MHEFTEYIYSQKQPKTYLSSFTVLHSSLQIWKKKSPQKHRQEKKPSKICDYYIIKKDTKTHQKLTVHLIVHLTTKLICSDSISESFSLTIETAFPEYYFTHCYHLSSSIIIHKTKDKAAENMNAFFLCITADTKCINRK